MKCMCLGNPLAKNGVFILIKLVVSLSLSRRGKGTDTWSFGHISGDTRDEPGKKEPEGRKQAKHCPLRIETGVPLPVVYS